ncbi:hypothetical protein K438DRAFT_1835473, partial [Mycena galopus ATCC 62051]
MAGALRATPHPHLLDTVVTEYQSLYVRGCSEHCPAMSLFGTGRRNVSLSISSPAGQPT